MVRRHSSFPVRRSRHSVSSCSPSCAVRKIRWPAKTGDDLPAGTAVFHNTLLAGPNSMGGSARSPASPVESGPRNCLQSGAAREGRARRARRRNRTTLQSYSEDRMIGSDETQTSLRLALRRVAGVGVSAELDGPVQAKIDRVRTEGSGRTVQGDHHRRHGGSRAVPSALNGRFHRADAQDGGGVSGRAHRGAAQEDDVPGGRSGVAQMDESAFLRAAGRALR